ncbi:carbohydrate-binding module family 13 protein, partial [Lasiosphaeria hispida]
MASLDTTSTYSLTNSYTGPEKLLAISTSDSKTPQMLAVPNSPASNAQWFLRATDYAPFYYLHTIRGGTGKALDVINDNDTSSRHLILANTGLYTGQFWRFDEWPSGGPYAYRLSNNFTGPDMHLDVYSDTLEPHLASDDASGQHWRL